MSATTEDALAAATRQANANEQAEARERAEHEDFLWEVYAASLQNRMTEDQKVWLPDAIAELHIDDVQIGRDRELLKSAEEHASLVANLARAEEAKDACVASFLTAVRSFVIAGQCLRTAESHVNACDQAGKNPPRLTTERPRLAAHVVFTPDPGVAPDLAEVAQREKAEPLRRMKTRRVWDFTAKYVRIE